MKKILILGGSRYILPVIDAIHKLGYYAITCDYLPDNIAHKFSDEYCNESIVDEVKILALAKKLKIDGIMSFACDPGVNVAAYVAEEMGLPYAGSYNSISILQNKGLFRKFLRNNNFNVPKAKTFTSVQSALDEVDQFEFPFMLKPVDSAGSKGVTKIDRIESLKGAAEHAIHYSKSKAFIVEEFIEQQGYSSDTDCFSINGNLVFTSFCNQYFDKNASNPYTPSGYSWPSDMTQKTQRELRSELQRLIKLLDLKTSIYNVETRQGIDGKAYIMEVSPRGGGNRLAEMLRYATGVDMLTNSVRAAVGEKIIGITGDPVYNGHWAEIILHAEYEGKYKELWIDESVNSFIVEKDIWIKPGDIVNKFSGANEAIGTLVFDFETKSQLDELMNNVENYVKVIIS